MRRWFVAVVILATVGSGAVAAGPANADILYSLPTKICAGVDGHGVVLRLSLNHGWVPSPKLRFRARLFGPNGRRVYPYGRFPSTKVWDLAQEFYADEVVALDYGSTVAGRYAVQFETYVAPTYAYRDSSEHRTGMWLRQPTMFVRAYRCR